MSGSGPLTLSGFNERVVGHDAFDLHVGTRVFGPGLLVPDPRADPGSCGSNEGNKVE